MCEVICWLFKLQIVLVFGQHLVSYVPGKFLHQTIMNLYKDIKEIQQGKMVSTKIKMITQLCDYCKQLLVDNEVLKRTLFISPISY